MTLYKIEVAYTNYKINPQKHYLYRDHSVSAGRKRLGVKRRASMQEGNFTEADWKFFRKKSPGWQDVHMDKRIRESVQLLSDGHAHHHATGHGISAVSRKGRIWLPVSLRLRI